MGAAPKSAGISMRGASHSFCTASKAHSFAPPRSCRPSLISIRSFTRRRKLSTKRGMSRSIRVIYGRNCALAYPINVHLKTLLDQAITDSRWDFTYLAMQVVIEGLALAAFGTIRDLATDPLGRAINAYVMQDEARHVAFGRLALREYYPQLTDKERDERETFTVVACYLMRDRFLAEEVWQNLDLGVDECVAYVRASPYMQE